MSHCQPQIDAYEISASACGSPENRWVTLDASGTLFRTSAATLCCTPSVLRAAAVRELDHAPEHDGRPIPVDVDAGTFKHVLDFLRYGRLEQDLTVETLHSIVQAARRLDLQELAVEAKYIYPLRQSKRRSRHTQSFARNYYRFVRESWIFYTAQRNTLAPKVQRAMDLLREGRPPAHDSRTERHTRAMLSRASQMAYVVGVLDFAEHLAHTGHIDAADKEMNLIAPFILTLTPEGPLAKLLRDGIVERFGDAVESLPFFALCGLTYAYIGGPAARSSSCDLTIAPQGGAVTTMVAAIAGHSTAKYSLHGTKLLVAAQKFTGKVPAKHISLMAQEARDARVAPANLAFAMLRHELELGRSVYDRHLLELLSSSSLESIAAQEKASGLCASLIAMLYMSRADRPRAERWIRRWLHDAERPGKIHESELITRCVHGLRLLNQKRHCPYALDDFAREVMADGIIVASGWRRLWTYLFGDGH